MPVVDLVYFNAGGGHRASALALETALSTSSNWQVRLVNLFEAIDPSHTFRRVTGTEPESWYNTRLALGWTAGLGRELKLLQALIRWGHPMMLARLQRYWARTKPDMVVSLVPNFNRVMFESVATARPGAPYVTLMTDLADYPPHFWIERNVGQHFICGTRRAVEQALAMGHPATRVHATSGMLLRPAFYESPNHINITQLATELRLNPNQPTGLVMFGGHGSRQMLGIARKLNNTQLIFICGHNNKLATTLRQLSRNAKHAVVEFTDSIQHYMSLADFFIGKPGPGSISEALQSGLPAVVVTNNATLPQERYNATWLHKNGFGIAHDSFTTIDEAVQRLLNNLAMYKRNVQRYENRAFFEIPEILWKIANVEQRA